MYIEWDSDIPSENKKVVVKTLKGEVRVGTNFITVYSDYGKVLVNQRYVIKIVYYNNNNKIEITEGK